MEDEIKEKLLESMRMAIAHLKVARQHLRPHAYNHEQVDELDGSLEELISDVRHWSLMIEYDQDFILEERAPCSIPGCGVPKKRHTETCRYCERHDEEWRHIWDHCLERDCKNRVPRREEPFRCAMHGGQDYQEIPAGEHTPACSTAGCGRAASFGARRCGLHADEWVRGQKCLLRRCQRSVETPDTWKGRSSLCREHTRMMFSSRNFDDVSWIEGYERKCLAAPPAEIPVLGNEITRSGLPAAEDPAPIEGALLEPSDAAVFDPECVAGGCRAIRVAGHAFCEEHLRDLSS
jgi:hypothetical protein